MKEKAIDFVIQNGTKHSLLRSPLPIQRLDKGHGKFWHENCGRGKFTVKVKKWPLHWKTNCASTPDHSNFTCKSQEKLYSMHL